MERRVIAAEMEVRAGAEDTPPQIVGYAAVFNSLSQVLWGFREKIAPGAFGASLADDVRALWNHDTAYVLGRTAAGTLRLSEDAKGLRVEIDPPETALAASFVESIRRGDVSQMSFGFSVLEDTWDEDDQGQMIRTLLKVKLYEVSPVTFPAYTETEVGVRALLGDEVTPPARAEELPVEEDEPNHDESDQRALVEIDAHDAALRAQAAERARRMQLAKAG
jgi:HK97 family phage prohead protease